MKLTGPAAKLKGSKVKITCSVTGLLDETYTGSSAPTLKWDIGGKAEDGTWDVGTKYSAVKEVGILKFWVSIYLFFLIYDMIITIRLQNHVAKQYILIFVKIIKSNKLEYVN